MGKRLIVVPLVVAFSTSFSSDDQCSGAIASNPFAWAGSPAAYDHLKVTIGAAVRDMKMPHESRPAGVPGGYDWAEGPTIQAGNKIPPNYIAITGFGEIQFATGSSVTAIRNIVMLRNFKTYILTRSNSLELVQSPDSIDGGQFKPDFQENVNTPAEMVITHGVTTVVTDPTRAFQFWPPNKAKIDPSAMKGIIVTVEAKIKPMTGRIDPHINTSYIMALGADYWRSLNSTWDNYTSSAGVGTGRFTFLTTSWRCYTFTSIGEADSTLSVTSFAC